MERKKKEKENKATTKKLNNEVEKMDAVPKRIAIENEEGREEYKGSDEDTTDGHKRTKSNFTIGDYVKITKNSYKHCITMLLLLVAVTIRKSK